MKIIKADINYLNDMVELAYATYNKECSYVSGLYANDYKKIIRKEISKAVLCCSGVICIEDEKLTGFLLCSNTWEDGDTIYHVIPSWGYGADGDKRVMILSRLFEELADKLCEVSKKVHFDIKLYAHDKEAIRLFSMMQFGIISEECIRNVESYICEEKISSISVLGKEDITKKWAEIWPILKKLIDHLKKSPVFYPGNEFTEEVYKEYLLDEATTFFVAEQNDKIIGIIDANADGNSFINNDDSTFNVGDIYVMDEYRGKGLAQQLLKFVNDYLKADGALRLWVEHGTANPNARGFWDKYFEPYIYCMIRDIER